MLVNIKEYVWYCVVYVWAWELITSCFLILLATLSYSTYSSHFIADNLWIATRMQGNIVTFSETFITKQFCSVLMILQPDKVGQYAHGCV